MNKLNIVFFGTPEFAVPCLQALCGSEKYHVSAVVTQPDRPVGRGLEVRSSPVKKVAQQFKTTVFQPEKINADIEAILKAQKPDLFVVVAFGQLLKQSLLDIPRLGSINVHSSLLPRWRGAAPIHWAILSGDTKTGVSIQRMVLKLDAGPVLGEVETEISNKDTLPRLHDRLADLAVPLLLNIIDQLESGTAQEKLQDESKVTYATKLTKEMEVLDPKLSFLELERKCRALIPWPGVSLRYKAQESERHTSEVIRLKIHEVQPYQFMPQPSIGEGWLVSRGELLLLGAKGGCLELLKVQLEGKRVVTAKEFLNGVLAKTQSGSRGQVFQVQVVSGSE